jgi:diphosphomevalonate decarboxylase
LDTFKVSWTSPSNIALVKYWGKYPVQIPANPSVSFTLAKSLSKLSIIAERESSKEINVDFYFENELNEKFKVKILKFLSTQIERFPWLLDFHLIIHSENTFPHSSGIASSASSMSALILALLSLDQQITGHIPHTEDFYKEASDLSRQASGSAGRSVYPMLATWGEIDSIQDSSQLFARPVEKNDVNPIFHNYCDSIIIVDAGEKSVSSRAGHALMETHPFAEQRYARARYNLARLLVALKDGDMQTFIEVVEEEALMLHSMMMTSVPSYILLKPDSLMLIDKIKEFRNNQKIPVCFTIDAGPNIHLLYPAVHKTAIQTWLSSEFDRFKIIHDEVGNGPELLKD